MTKQKTTKPLTHCVYSDFIDSFPPGYRPSLPNLLQRSRRGTFVPYIRLDGKSSPALFERASVAAWADSRFAEHFATNVEDIRKALGLKTSGKRRKPNA